ncbi:Apolipoprotein L6 [Merluccius polli]|uniref:Apolipoprotein L6 n=1 Tax=Merluccius polli TaxID=89951 RepID=A0AA47P703_MERPO|nr:Apolipoprotein L6 [Merluccius polli]
MTWRVFVALYSTATDHGLYSTGSCSLLPVLYRPMEQKHLGTPSHLLRSFKALADKVHRGLRIFDKVFTERGELLWQYIIALHAINDDISNFHQKAMIANITGGTTAAVGGVAAITGLVLAPLTFGVSLIITAVGVSVAAAGGITSASASISDNVNNMHDRKKLEIVLKAYEAHLLELARVLSFVSQGLYRLRGHPLLRTGNQHYAADWEVRHAVQTIGQVDGPVARASVLTDESVVSLRGLFQGMDKYFVKDSRELKKGYKEMLVAEVRGVVNKLNGDLVELSAIRQELQDATGGL